MPAADPPHAERALLAWLGERVAPMAAGADALPAVKTPVAWLCEQWQSELREAPLLPALASWAKA